MLQQSAGISLHFYLLTFSLMGYDILSLSISTIPNCVSDLSSTNRTIFFSAKMRYLRSHTPPRKALSSWFSWFSLPSARRVGVSHWDRTDSSRTLWNSAIKHLGNYSEKWKDTYPDKHLNKVFIRSIVCNIPRLGTTKMPFFGEWLKSGMFTLWGILKDEKLNESQDHCAEWI